MRPFCHIPICPGSIRQTKQYLGNKYTKPRSRRADGKPCRDWPSQATQDSDHHDRLASGSALRPASFRETTTTLTSSLTATSLPNQIHTQFTKMVSSTYVAGGGGGAALTQRSTIGTMILLRPVLPHQTSFLVIGAPQV